MLNQNGKKVLNFCITNDIVIGNTFYDHDNEPQYTYESDNGEKRNIVDYI